MNNPAGACKETAVQTGCSAVTRLSDIAAAQDQYFDVLACRIGAHGATHILTRLTKVASALAVTPQMLEVTLQMAPVPVIIERMELGDNCVPLFANDAAQQFSKAARAAQTSDGLPADGAADASELRRE